MSRATATLDHARTGGDQLPLFRSPVIYSFKWNGKQGGRVAQYFDGIITAWGFGATDEEAERDLFEKLGNAGAVE